MKNSFDIKKPDVKLEEIQKLEFPLIIVLGYFIGYAELHSLPVVITSINERVNGRMSRTHEEFRAVDIATRLWSKDHCLNIQRLINEKYSDWATGPVNGTKRVVVYGDAKHLNHLHLQVRRNIKLETN